MNPDNMNCKLREIDKVWSKSILIETLKNLNEEKCTAEQLDII